jgi:hypothetical protein
MIGMLEALRFTKSVSLWASLAATASLLMKHVT